MEKCKENETQIELGKHLKMKYLLGFLLINEGPNDLIKGHLITLYA